MRDFLKVKRVIVKIGSSSLVNSDLSVNMDQIRLLMRSFYRLKEKNIDIALVTSGAIAVGMHELGIASRPKNMALKQACAAIGQTKLMEAYNYAGNALGLVCGQILVNHDDFQVRKRMNYLSATLDELFKNGVIPIINENDALAVEEIKVGDNDTLSSLIAPMIDADLLILFSDIDGLYDKNPKEFSDAKLIPTIDSVTKETYEFVGEKASSLGTGGMETKLNAARISTLSGCDMVICNSSRIKDLEKIVLGEEIGTLFKASRNEISNRDHWMIFKTIPSGSITIDEGLSETLNNKKVSILAKGIIDVDGDFTKDEVIDIKNQNGEKLGKGISYYSSSEINLIKGLKSSEFESVLKYKGKKEIIHANNLVLYKEV